MKIMKILFMCIFVAIAAVFFWRLVEDDISAKDRKTVQSETLPASMDHSYYMKAKSGNIVIFNKDHTVYEYTDLEPEFLPDDVVTKLIQGIYFKNQEDLYEFLETYSS